MEADYKDIEMFIREQLAVHGEAICDKLINALEQNKNIKTGDLENAIACSTSDEGAFITEQIKFIDYGRAFEIAGYKKNSAEKFAENTNKAVWGVKNRTKKNKNTKWYARNMYSNLGALVRTLAAGMSDDELFRIKNMIKANVTSPSAKILMK